MTSRWSVVATLSFGLLGLLALPAEAAAGPADWPQFRAGPAHTGSDVPSVITPANVATLEEAWEIRNIGGITSSPAVAGGVVYAGSADHSLYAVPAGFDCSPVDCNPRWKAPTNGPIESSPAVAGGVVYVGSTDNSLYAFDAVGGDQRCSVLLRICSPLWTAPTGGPISSSPAVAGGRVYVGSNDDKLYAFDAAGCGGSLCAPLWTATTGGDVFSSPAVSGGIVFVGSDDGKVYAFDASGVTNCNVVAKTCNPLWTVDTGSPVQSSPAVADGVVHVGSVGGTLYALAAASGAILWTAAPGGLVSSPAVAGGVVYVGSFDKKLYAYDADGGTGCTGSPKICDPLWTAVTSTMGSDPVISSPAVANGLVFVGSGSNSRQINAFDAAGTSNCSGAPRTCAPLWTGDTETGVRSSPAIAGGTVYLGRDVLGLMAFRLPGLGAGEYHPLTPARILDTRQTDSLDPNETRSLSVVGSAGVPASGVSSVVLNVAVTQPTAGGYLTVSPAGSTRPLASSVNFAAGETVSNMVVAKVGTYGEVDIYNAQGSTHVVVDVQGWFGLDGAAPGARYNSLAPARILDTRQTAPVGPNGTVSLTVAGTGGVPALGVSSVVLNVAVTQPTAGGWLTVYPAGANRPLASSINFAPGQTLSNAVVAKVGAGGQVDIYNAYGATHVVVDVQGWFRLAGVAATGARYNPLTPARLYDTRQTIPVAPNGILSLVVAGRAGVPGAGVSSVVLNVAVTQPTSGGWLTVFPTGTDPPLASSINFAPGQTLSNTVVAKMGVDGQIEIRNALGTTHVVVDVQGWFGN